jgi:2-phosphoglycerate kinase
MVRDATSEGLRPHEKYTDRLYDIRRIQDHIVARARRHKVPVIENSNIDAAIGSVIDLVLAGAEQVQKV